jgi:PAS domain S-box-containing protein
MHQPRPAHADRAYRRLARRDARRSLEVAVLVAALPSALNVAIHVVLGAPPMALGFAAFCFACFAAIAVAAFRVPERWLDTVAAFLGAVAIVNLVGATVTTPAEISSVAISFLGVVPVGITLISLWDARTHATWLITTSITVAAMVVANFGSGEVRDQAWKIAGGWTAGVLVSLFAQHAIEKGRRAALSAMDQAHLGRIRNARVSRRLQALEAIGRALSEHGPTDATLDAAMHLLRDDFGYGCPSIYLGDDQRVRLGAQLGYDQPIREFIVDQGVTGRVMRTRRAELLADAPADPDFIGARTGIRSEIAAPLLAGPRFLGVLNVETDYELGPGDLASVSIVADRFAAAIALADRRAALRAALEASPLPILTYDADKRVTYWNAAATDVFGWEAGEVVGLPAPLHAMDEPVAVEIERRIASGGRVIGVDAERLHRDGHALAVRIFAAPFGDRPPYGTIAVYQDLSGERAATAALRESETRFETVIGSLREGVVVLGPDGRVRWSNPAAERLLGRPPAEVIGREARATPGRGLVHADGRPFTMEELPGTIAARTGRVVTGVVMGMPRDGGEPAWALVDAIPLRAGADEPPSAVVVALADITERKRHEDELRLSERRVRSVLEQAASPMLGVAADGRITFVNTRAVDLFGYDADELVGQPVELLVPDALADVHVHLRSGYVEHPVPRPLGVGMELKARRHDGALIPVEIAINPVETPTGREFYATVIDTTERHRIEAELLQAAKMDSIGRLAGGIAHDFNNLLTAIMGYGRMATASLDPADPALAEVEQVLLAADRAADLTRRLLGFARKTVLDPAVHDLNGIVATLEPFLRRMVGERVAVVTRLDPSAGSIRVDRTEAEQILMNLAVNARDAMPDGGTLMIETLSVEASSVDPMLGVSGERVAVVAVTDTGTGMSEAVRARVFEPFFTTKPFGQGTGLGLATTYGILRQSGGAITVDSRLGAGSTFRIYFPQVPADPLPVVRENAPVVHAARSELRVLVVEDEESLRMLVARMLERLGYTVLQAPNGAAALSLTGGRLDELDLLLTDVVMPGMRGPELAASLRVARPDLPVVFMSGYAAAEGPGAGIPPGATLLGKPFTMEELSAAVARQLNGATVGARTGGRTGLAEPVTGGAPAAEGL